MQMVITRLDFERLLLVNHLLTHTHRVMNEGHVVNQTVGGGRDHVHDSSC